MGTQKQAEVAILISDKTDWFQAKISQKRQRSSLCIN
jgi:hypothetical protein